MHELSLAGGILCLVEQAAARDRFSRVARLKLAAGELSGVEVSALRFALESLAPGTCLEGSAIEIDEPPGYAWCSACQCRVALHMRGDACPLCGGYALRPTDGTELRVVDLLVHDD